MTEPDEPAAAPADDGEAKRAALAAAWRARHDEGCTCGAWAVRTLTADERAELLEEGLTGSAG